MEKNAIFTHKYNSKDSNCKSKSQLLHRLTIMVPLNIPRRQNDCWNMDAATPQLLPQTGNYSQHCLADTSGQTSESHQMLFHSRPGFWRHGCHGVIVQKDNYILARHLPCGGPRSKGCNAIADGE